MIQTDGQIYTGHRDPPGQFTAYIPSGDTRKESYRAVTFRSFPGNVPVDSRILANSGFYYTGYKDRVKCFSCASIIESWVAGDDPKDQRWHRDDCDFANGRDRTNEPILGIFKRCLASSSALIANSAFTTQFSVRNSGRPTAAILEEHSQRSVAGQTFQGASNATQNSGISSPSPASTIKQSPVNSEYPCLYPVNPHMRSTVTRLQTFKPSSTVRWPREKLRAGIDEITSAGFFYLGERDRVKCWYCNGGLQNWDYEDDPWTEHAKWFPSCEFLLQVKGRAFVNTVVEQNPNINRPTPTVRIVKQKSNNASSQAANSSHQQSCNTKEVEHAMRTQTYVAQAKDMGFDEDDIRAALKRKHNTDCGLLFESIEEFLDALTSMPTPQKQPTPLPSQDPSRAQSTSSVQRQEEVSNSSMLSELRSMEESRLCKICYKDPSDVVLIPCGHLACCSSCSSADLRRCPLCHRGIQERIKAFRS